MLFVHILPWLVRWLMYLLERGGLSCSQSLVVGLPQTVTATIAVNAMNYRSERDDHSMGSSALDCRTYVVRVDAWDA